MPTDWAELALRGTGCAIENGSPQSEIDAQVEIIADWWREPGPYNPRVNS